MADGVSTVGEYWCKSEEMHRKMVLQMQEREKV